MLVSNQLSLEQVFMRLTYEADVAAVVAEQNKAKGEGK